MITARIKYWIEKCRISLSNNEHYIKILREKGVQIGSGCVIDKSAEFGTEPYLISLANNVRITSGVKFITHDGGLWVPRKMGLLHENADRFGRIHIGENTNVGWNAIIMPGVSIGKNCVIGCGAVVTKSFPDNSVIAGVPAKIIETVEEYAAKNVDKCINTAGMPSNEKKKLLMDKY